MKRNPIITVVMILYIPTSFCMSCKKKWLDAKPDQKLVVPSTLKDMQALLDYTSVFNAEGPNLGEIGCDDYYITYTLFQSRNDKDRNTYMWAPEDGYGGSKVIDWEQPYQQVYYANIVLEGISKISKEPSNAPEWNNIKGSALFYRAIAFHRLSQLFCKPFRETFADSEPGIIIRTESDINAPSVRATIAQTYDQIIADLMTSKVLLSSQPLYNTRPSRQAAFALLARTYLSMEKYDSALVYADSCLKTYSTLADYNNTSIVNIANSNPFIYTTNPEIIFLSRQSANAMLAALATSGNVDSSLYQSYSSNDKRRDVFFRQVSSGGRIAFIGSYMGANYLFDGLATDEVYLIRSECYARDGNVALAMQDLNALLSKRWNTGSGQFIPQTASDANEALLKVIAERRKELCFRGIRWSDLRRLNNNPLFSKTVTHGLLNSPTTCSLLPNDNKYIWPIPESEIMYTSIPQNLR